MPKSTHSQVNRIRQTLFRHKKRMVSPSFPSPHLVWSSLRWSACHNSKQASGHMQMGPRSHLIGTKASFDAIRGRGASVTTNSGAQLASGLSALNEGLISQYNALQRSRRHRPEEARQLLRNSAGIEKSADGRMKSC